MSQVERHTRGALIVHARPVYRLVRGFLVVYLGLWHRFRVEGVEHLPKKGGVLIVSNHQSFLDIPILAVAAPRHVAYVARSTLARSRFIDFLIRESGSVLVKQNSPDRAALEGMIGHLEQGDCVVVFPEGTRTRDGSMGSFRPGAVVAARRSGAPIVPAAIFGAFEALPRNHLVPRPVQLMLRFGPPVAAGTENALEVARGTIERMLADGRGSAR